MKNLLFKNIQVEVKLDAEKRKIEGYGAVFGNVDSYGDIIQPGAFGDTLKKRTPKMLYQHRSDKLIGVWDVAREDNRGLYLEGRLAKTANGDEAYELAQMGALDGMSIGYFASEYENNDKGERLLKRVDLYEVSLVTFPANEEARVSNVKGHDNERDFERFLREAGGYSREAAKIIAAHGFKALSGQRDVGAGDSALKDIRRLIETQPYI